MRFCLQGLGFVVILCLSGLAWAGQPVFSEMPRWDDGWGFQLVPEYRYRQGIISGSDVIDDDVSEHFGILHIDGVYTWDRRIRVTAKLPVVLIGTRETKDAAGKPHQQADLFLGDATVAIPLKHYYNLDGRSGSWTLAPQLRIPLGPKHDYSVFPRVWGAGLTAGVETETYRYHGALAFGGWYFSDDKPAKFQASLSTGFNVHAFGSSGHAKVKASVELEDDGSILVQVSSIFYWRFSDLVHGQMTWTMDAYNWQATPTIGNTQSATAGVGFVY
jgi:hypothetical protein